MGAVLIGVAVLTILYFAVNKITDIYTRRRRLYLDNGIRLGDTSTTTAHLQENKNSETATRRQTRLSHKAGKAALARIDDEKPKRKFTEAAAAVKRMKPNEKIVMKPPKPLFPGKGHTLEGNSPNDTQNVNPNIEKQDEKEDIFSQKPADASTSFAVDSVFLVCPMCSLSSSADSIAVHLRDCLEAMLASEPLMISATMLHTLNTEEEWKSCIKIIQKYLQNIIDNPDDLKFRKIPESNRVFQERVLSCSGALQFITLGCGFELKSLPCADNKDGSDSVAENKFYVLRSVDGASDAEALSTHQKTKSTLLDHIEVALNVLLYTKPLEPTLDRNVKVFRPSSRANRIQLPDSFYRLTTKDIRYQQSENSKDIRRLMTLGTKSTHEKIMKPKARKSYRYVVLRIRFPDGMIIQGTFETKETFHVVTNFVRENLNHGWLPFTLCDSIGREIVSAQASLSSLKLAPASFLTLVISDESKKALPYENVNGVRYIQYLKDEALVLTKVL